MAVAGIGGFFFRARDPKALGEWYATHLGIGGGAWGKWEQAAGPSVFAPFAAGTTHFPADRPFMLDLRVDDLDGVMAHPAATGIAVRTDPEWDAPGVGRFARIHDPEGNPVELWEPDPAA